MMSLGPGDSWELKISEVFRVYTNVVYTMCFSSTHSEYSFKKSCSVIILKKFTCVCVCNRLFSCQLPLWMLCCAHEMCCSGKKLCVPFLYPIHETVGSQRSYKGTCGVHCWPSCVYLLICILTLNIVLPGCRSNFLLCDQKETSLSFFCLVVEGSSGCGS